MFEAAAACMCKRVLALINATKSVLARHQLSLNFISDWILLQMFSILALYAAKIVFADLLIQKIYSPE